ncbi:hypothetical protein BU15DRAFT_67267 [Melanogaster broomeanus]|nr:hypothetical protein BU15DRAFT_67267 [Melanogaster broomeanus]
MSAATNLTGTYYISSRLGTYLTFTDTNSETNLTTSQYSGTPEQQWVLAPGMESNASSPMYTVKNVKYQTYVSYYATNNPGNAVGQSSLPLNWFVNIVNVSQTPSQYQFAVDPLIVSTWRDYLGSVSNGNPVVIAPCCNNVINGYWVLSSVSNTSASMGSASPSSALTTNSATASPQIGSSASFCIEFQQHRFNYRSRCGDTCLHLHSGPCGSSATATTWESRDGVMK